MAYKTMFTGVLMLPLSMGFHTTASALDLTSGTFYVGGGIGASWLDPETDGTLYSVSDDQDFAWHLLGGYRINDNFSVELAYTDLGKADIQYSSFGSSAGEISYSQTTLGVLWFPTLRPDLTWQPYLKGGVNYSDRSWDRGDVIYDDWGGFAGIGIEKQLGRYDLALRGEYTYYAKDAQALNFSLVKYFND
jgi:OOP family OmpA-OmpF porin